MNVRVQCPGHCGRDHSVCYYGEGGGEVYAKGACPETGVYFELHVWQPRAADPAWYEGTGVDPPEEARA